MKAWSYSQELGFILTWSNPKTRRGSGIYKLRGVKPGYKAAARQICAQAVSDVRWVSDVLHVGRPKRGGNPTLAVRCPGLGVLLEDLHVGRPSYVGNPSSVLEVFWIRRSPSFSLMSDVRFHVGRLSCRTSETRRSSVTLL